MAFSRPSLTTLVSRISADIESRSTSGSGSTTPRRSVERILARVLAGIGHGFHGHLEWLYEQLTPVTCGEDVLVLWGNALGVTRNAAVKANRGFSFPTTAASQPFPAGTRIQVGGVVFVADATYTTGASTVTGQMTAEVAGADYNVADGAEAELVSPVEYVESTGGTAHTDATSPFTHVDGSDLESVEAYRVRILERLQSPPKGGVPGDYVAWAKEVSGVTRAWEFGNRMGYGTVSLAFVRDGDASIIPDAAEVTAVQDYIDALRPLDMLAVYVQAPVANPVDVTVALTPNTAPVQAAVTSALEALFAETDLETAGPTRSQISEAISTAAGETSHTLSAPASTPDPGDWGINTLGTVTFT